MFRSTIGFVILGSVVLAQQECEKEVVLGKSCAGKKPVTKWYYDNKLNFCYPYQFLGCEEGSNSHESQDRCLESCKPADQFSCGGNTDSKGVCFTHDDKACKSGTVCIMGGTLGFCCDEKIQDQWDKEHSPKCDKGESVKITMWFGKSPLIGRSCSHNFCPAGSKCIQGRWTAHCCQ